MRAGIATLAFAANLVLPHPAAFAADDTAIVIAHRGASGYLPEHTLAAYYVAILQGADYIEPDLVMTRDGRLVARHENEISQTTDVAARPEFSSRRKTRTIDGVPVEGWFTEDFTLAELKQLRARERIPKIRPANARFDGMFEVPTLEEVLDLLRAVNAGRPKDGSRLPVGIYPETKHPSYFASIGLPMEAPLVRILHRYGYRGRAAPVFIQSFETGNLRRLATLTRLPLIQLLTDRGAPYDLAASGDPRSYADLATPAGLAEIARYARGVGLNKNMIFPPRADGSTGTPTRVVHDARHAGLLVHAWTFRQENTFLPAGDRVGLNPGDAGNLDAEIARFLELGIHGIFTDQPDIGVRARRARSAAQAR